VNLHIRVNTMLNSFSTSHQSHVERVISPSVYLLLSIFAHISLIDSKPSANVSKLNWITLNWMGFCGHSIPNIFIERGGVAYPPLSTANLVVFSQRFSEQLHQWNQRGWKGHRLCINQNPSIALALLQLIILLQPLFLLDRRTYS
jgi:hypothetical protein